MPELSQAVSAAYFAFQSKIIFGLVLDRSNIADCLLRLIILIFCNDRFMGVLRNNPFIFRQGAERRSIHIKFLPSAHHQSPSIFVPPQHPPDDSWIPKYFALRGYAQKVKISNLQQMAKTVAYIQEHGYDTQKKLQDTTDTIQSKMAKARSDAKLTEAKLKKVNEQIHYLGQYLSTKSVYADFLKSTNKKDFRQNHADEIAEYEEALQFLKQNSPDGKLPTMKDLRSEKELLVQQKSAQYETYQYFRDYHRELQTVCENVNHILDASQTKQQEQKKSHQSEHSI